MRKSVQGHLKKARSRIENKMSEDRRKMKLRERLETKRSQTLPVLRKVHPKVPTDEGDLECLRSALERMGCVGLLDVS